MSKTETVPTLHGDVEYEVVECSSCGNVVAKEDAKRFVIGDILTIRHYASIGKREYVFRTSDYQEGWACEYCRNDSIVDFPLTSVTDPSVAQMVLLSVAAAFFAGLLVGGVL